MLKLRKIGLNDYNVIENGHRIGRICYAVDRSPGVWIWYIQIHFTGGLPMGTSRTFEAAKGPTWRVRTTTRAITA